MINLRFSRLYVCIDVCSLYIYIGCPRIIRICSFSRFSPLRWNRWCCGFQNFQNYSSRVKAKVSTLFRSVTRSGLRWGIIFPFLLKDQTGNKVLERSATPASTTDPLAWYLLESLRAKCGISWMSVAPKFSSISSSFFVCRRACAAFRLILINIASWRLTTHISIKFWHTNNMKIVLAIPFWLLVSLHVFWYHFSVTIAITFVASGNGRDFQYPPGLPMRSLIVFARFNCWKIWARLISS